MRDEERCDFNNLILLCRNCHKITNNIELFPVIQLQKIKTEHESKALTLNFTPTNKQVESLLSSLSYNLDYVEHIEWGVLETIIKYVLEKSSNTKPSLEEVMQKSFLHIREKLPLNFPEEQYERFIDIYQKTATKRTTIEFFFENTVADDPTKIDDLIEFIIESFCNVKGVSVPNVAVDDIKYFGLLANYLIPESKKNAPEYKSAAMALVIHTFELCHIGNKTTKEKSPILTLFS